MEYDARVSHKPALYLPAVWPVPHPGDKEQKVNYEDSCTLARRHRPRPRCRCHPPRNRGGPCAANVSRRWQGFGLPNTLQKHNTLLLVSVKSESPAPGELQRNGKRKLRILV
jgi:hypothetical protein